MTRKLYLTRGLPASGKTTYARAWVAADPGARARVNRDDIRYMLFGAYTGLSSDEENAVTRIETASVKSLLYNDFDVIVDAMNLNSRTVRSWRGLSYNVGATLDTFNFGASIQSCIEGDRKRQLDGARFVGEQAIREIAARYRIPENGTLPDIPGPRD